MAVLLTGASGFVGRNLARVLLARGEQVVLFASSMATMPVDGLAGAILVEGDIRSGDDLRRAFQAAPIDRVVHAAAVTPDIQAEIDSPATVIEVNLGGTTNLMRASQRAGVTRVLALSSVAAYGSAEVAPGARLDEQTTVPRPASLYGVTKLATEGVVRRLGELHAIETTTVRLGPCFGIGEHPTGLRPLMSPHWQCARAAWAGEECVLPRDLRGDWLDVEQAADAVADLLAAPHAGPGPFSLGGGRMTTVAAWCDALAQVRPGFVWRVDPTAPTIRHGLERDRPGMDNGRLRAAIGWAPETGDLVGLASRFLEWRSSAEGRKLCGEEEGNDR